MCDLWDDLWRRVFKCARAVGEMWIGIGPVQMAIM